MRSPEASPSSISPLSYPMPPPVITYHIYIYMLCLHSIVVYVEERFPETSPPLVRGETVRWRLEPDIFYVPLVIGS